MSKITRRYLKYITLVSYFLDLVVLNLFAKRMFPFANFSLYYALFIVLSWTIISLNIDFYHIRRLSNIRSIIIKIVKQFIVFTIICYAFTGIYKPQSDTTLVIKYVLISFLFISIIKILHFYLTKKFQKVKKVIIIGKKENTLELKNFFNENPSLGYKFINVLSIYSLQCMEESISFIEENKIDEIYCSLNDMDKDQLFFYSNYADNNLKSLKFIANEKELLISNYKIEYYGHIPIASYINIHNEDKTLLLLKRIFDVVFSLVIAILILSWLVPIIAVIIKLTSKGPIFYLQERIGKDEHPFKIIKFRSMKIDAEASGPKLSSDNDNRITPIGKIIRKYRIDEFPQFINVLKGDMSIVGPRPEREFFINEILKVNPKYKRLHNVKPGITSLGQVYYGYAENISEMDKRLQYDLLYLKNFSFITDIKIILLTISIVFKGKGK
jgi:putative colanic acid biosynthesis UDP-glucose lipid carrier transferase